jgi:hypothetical protein
VTRKSRREIEAQVEQIASETSSPVAGGDISTELKEDMRTVLRFRYSRGLYIDGEMQAQLLCSAYTDGVEKGEVSVEDLDIVASDVGIGQGRTA